MLQQLSLTPVFVLPCPRCENKPTTNNNLRNSVKVKRFSFTEHKDGWQGGGRRGLPRSLQEGGARQCATDSHLPAGSCTTFTHVKHSSRSKDLELQDKGDGNTGLMLAAREGHLPIVTALLLHGAKVNAANK